MEICPSCNCNNAYNPTTESCFFKECDLWKSDKAKAGHALNVIEKEVRRILGENTELKQQIAELEYQLKGMDEV